MYFQTKISQITMYFQSKNTKNDAFSKYIFFIGLTIGTPVRART